ncbi:unnamed protein product [Moneuplotes crassus]|uniref:Penicillin amidase n=1 Tax=Euplotes crassus TaxID=5936 RepID=A0AAD2D4W9_EUPCR|nr:unnamed protein product [Moneuplotes crassus]
MGLCFKFLVYVIAIVMFLYSFAWFVFEINKLGGTYTVITNFGGAAEVFLEDNGVPRIVADNELAGAYANGYVLASNRLWQMEYLRRLSQGRMSEIFGKATVPLDEGFRILGFTNVCEKELKYFGDTDKEYFDAFFQGINDYAHTHTRPFQFFAFGISHQNYTVLDTCTLYKLMGFMLSGDWGSEILRDYMSAVTQDEELIQAISSYSDEKFDEMTQTILKEEELMDIGLHTTKKPSKIENPLKGNISEYIEEVVSEMIEEIDSVKFDGSNAWVISGEHTETGKPIISNDPHLGNSLPSIWYYSHIEYSDGRFISGVTLPGIPYFAIFATEKVAFTITAIPADSSDVYKEKIVGDKYEYEGKLYPLEVREEIIKVKKKDDIVLKVKSTRHGPLINTKSIESLSNIAHGGPVIMPNGTYSYKWRGIIAQKNNALHILTKVNRAQSAAELLDLVKTSNGVNINVVVCDNLGEHGNIGFAPYGSYPKRTKDAGHRISRGWINENEWDGDIKGEDKPYLWNPKKGYIVMANNPISTANTKSQISTYSLGTARALRITQLIEELIKTKSGKIGYDDMIEILKDIKDPYAEQKKKYLVKIARDYMKNEGIKNGAEEEVMDKIEKWDSIFDEKLTEPVYFTLWEFFFRSSFMSKNFKDNKLVQMKIISNTYGESNFIHLYKNISANNSHFAQYCQTYASLPSSSCAENIYLALNQTLRYLIRFHSMDATWGELHTMQYPNIPFTRTYLKPLYDREIPASGNSNTINVAGFKFSKFEGKNNENPYSLFFDPKREFPATHSANLKLVVPMDGTVFYSLDTGISESLMSGWYFNMNGPHRENKLFKTDFTKKLEGQGDFKFIFGQAEQEKVDDL